MFDFTNKVAVVTGSSRSIGRSIALALARCGCAVTINYSKSRDEAEEVVNSIRQMGGKAIAVRCDVSKREEVENMFTATVDEFDKVDILVNNAGIAIGASLLETTDEIWDKHMEINLKGVFLCTQIAARHMIERNYGKIVNISSNSGFGIAMPGDNSYAVSKAGVIQLTKSSAFELGRHNINVNCVAPGAVDTVMLRGNRSDDEYEKVLEGRRDASSLGMTGTPEDIANAVLFFASDESRYITGKILLVDGGRRDFL
ncbi:3-oxoacyl-ACP reductase FabG [Candidatus Bathyarchaeota archaeon]|nr:3-oxoacyl-ACP reductase FabG [Candidatus Bathyarchaeota archaeon]